MSTSGTCAGSIFWLWNHNRVAFLIGKICLICDVGISLVDLVSRAS